MISPHTPALPHAELVLVPDRDGVYSALDDSPVAPTAEAPTGLVVSESGAISITGPAGARPVSALPAERMAGGDPWEQIIAQIRQQEDHGPGGTSVVVRPGGGLEVTSAQDAAGKPISKIPEVRMASTAVAEAAELRLLDPANVENWQRVSSESGEVTGWTFYLQPPYQREPFKFLVFRNPSRRNLWDVSPLSPNFDTQRGHTAHMIGATIAGHEVAILCGPGGQGSVSLTAARGVAAKWMYYTSARMAHKNPGFSL
jgi:hypothetical protein